MATPGKSLNDILIDGKPTPAGKPDDPDDIGPCAARVKDRWITALTVKHKDKAWESFQYSGIGTHSWYTPIKFEVVFAAFEKRWRITVEGRNLWTIYNGIIQHRIEWIAAADRDFGPDAASCIKRIEVVEVEVED